MKKRMISLLIALALCLGLTVPALAAEASLRCTDSTTPGVVRLDAAAGREVLRQTRPRLRFAKKVSLALEEEAVASLAQAKAMHDDLEAIYNPHVDFDRVEQLACSISDELLS